ncbi:2-dehydro-3-deoxyphosphogluconate aldolase [Eubacteriales bacterium OttesenSCG-928-K08]|nr:2-dehydro-3-deoxyphosphogluconate aldolase [Eubacteriales bacterium OttesenSCG-928-K08]
MNPTFELAHIGINLQSGEEAAQLANALAAMFSLPIRQGNKGPFCGEIFECMNTPHLGKHGHIALYTDRLQDAREHLKALGYTFLEETVKYDENGQMKNGYLEGEFGGFAIHIMQK